uniref:Protein MAK10 homolog n=1 Tax=Globodera pallida TaxID=36090 RepID=A0A183BJV2_GLOPA
MDLFLSSADALAFEITDQFADGCKVLNDHEFSMDESFKLSDAMSAIELMDAKMDSGMKFVERKLDYFLNNLKDELDKIGIAEIIAIFDASYSVLASWLNGQPPDQTLNTNLCFLVQPELLKQSPYLYTISCAVLFFTKESDALRLRLEYLTAFLELMNLMLPSVDLLIENPIDVETRFVPDLKRSNLLLAKCIQLNSMISDTICCGAQPSDGVDADFSWLSVFDANASLYSSLPSFPRKPRLLSRIDACKYFNDVMEKTLFVTTNLPEMSLTVEGIMNLLQRVGGQNSCILVRSIAQLLIMPNDHFICGTTSLADIESKRETKRNVQTLGHNLSRQMDKFLRIIFEEFGALIIEANKIETALEFARMNLKQDNSDSQMPHMQHMFSNFFLQTILVLMHHHFSLAFRMRLIQPYEFHYIYWYFGEYVLKNLSNMCERVCNALIFDFSRSTLHQQKKVSGKKRQQKTKIDNEFRKTLSLIKARSLYHRVETVMCQAMCNISLGLIISRRMAVPSREHLRYAKRVEPFLALPPLLFYSYEEYLRESRITDLKANSTDRKCFENAAELFSQTLILMKNSELSEDDPMLATMASLHQVAKQNMVVAKLLATQGLEKKLSFEFPAEQINFPMIRLL